MLQQFVFNRINLDDPDRDLAPGDYRYAMNLIPQMEGLSATPRRQNIKSNVIIENTWLPPGNNKVIGSYFDKVGAVRDSEAIKLEGPRIVYLIYNDIGKHSIFEYYVNQDNTRLIIQHEGLDFTEFGLASAITITNDILFYVVNEKAYSFHIGDAIDGYYTDDFPDKDTFNSRIAYTKTSPALPATCVKVVENEDRLNLISAHHWHFYYRYVYRHWEKSLLSPASDVVIGDTTPNMNLPYEFNAIDVTVPIPNVKRDLLQYIEVISNRDDSADYYSFAKIKAGRSLTVRFRDNEVQTLLPEADVNQTASSNPITTTSLALAANRVFSVVSSKGSDANFSMYEMSAEIIGINEEDKNTEMLTVLPGGRYFLGLYFYDEKSHKTTIPKTIVYDVPQKYYKDIPEERPYVVDWGLNYSAVQRIRVTVSGEAPAGYTHYGLAVSKEQIYSQYMQVGVNVMFYIGDEGDYETAPDHSMLIAGAYWSSILPDYWSKPIGFQLPINVPFVPQPGVHRIKIITDGINTIDEVVTDVRGNIIITDNFGISDWKTILFTEGKPIYIQIYSLNEKASNIMYEVGEIHEITNGYIAESPSTIKLDFKGDNYWIWPNNPVNWFYIPHVYYNVAIKWQYEEYDGWDFYYPRKNSRYINCITPTNITTKKLIVFSAEETSINVPSKEELYTFDYTKISSMYSKANVYKEMMEQKAGNIIGISDNFVANTKINGLNITRTENQYAIESSYGSIQRLITVTQKLMLAVLERYTFSLYLGEAFLRTGAKGELTAKVEHVIGDNRELLGNFGTINPESFTVHDGRVYWWDMYRKDIVRYAGDGIIPLGEKFKFKKEMADIADQISPYRDRARVISTWHPLWDMLIVSFLPVRNDEGTIIFTGKTIAFKEPKQDGTGGLITYLSFVPEMYAMLPMGIVSFKDGNMYRHEKGSGYNRFYGVYEESIMKVVANEHPELDKIWTNIALNSYASWEITITNNEQKSTLDRISFIKKQDTWYADFLRDENTPNIVSPKTPLLHGDTLISQSANIELKNPDVEYVDLNEIFVGYHVIQGQLLTAKKK